MAYVDNLITHHEAYSLPAKMIHIISSHKYGMPQLMVITQLAFPTNHLAGSNGK